MLKQQIRLAAVIGATVSITSALSFLLMLVRTPDSLLTEVASIWFAVSLPGELVGGIFAAIAEKNPHGGGSLLDYIVVIVPFNFLLYSLLSFGVIHVAWKVRHRSKIGP